MKIKSVVDICKKSGFMYLIMDKDGIQWLGDGVAYYPLVNAPVFDEESIYSTFDITEKAAEGIIFRNEEIPEGFNFGTDCDGEMYAERNDVVVSYRNKEYYIYHTEDGALYVNVNYLRPLEKDNVEVYIRYTKDKKPYFVYKLGYMVQAVVAPVTFDSRHKEFFENLSLLYKQTKKRMEGIVNVQRN